MVRLTLRLWDRENGRTKNASISSPVGLEATLSTLLGALAAASKPSEGKDVPKDWLCVTLVGRIGGRDVNETLRIGGE